MNTPKELEINTLSEQESNPSTNHSTLAEVFRWAGALTVSISAVTFLIQGPFAAWTVGRLLGFLIFIVLLGVLGFTTGLTLQERKGARLFLLLGSLLAPVAWTQLGALTYATQYSVLHWMPAMLRFRAVSPTTLTLLILATGLVTTKTNYLSYSTLAGRQQKTLTSLALLGGIVLIIPMRDPGLVAIIVGVASYKLLSLAKKLRSDLERGFTWEEILALSTLSIPLIIMSIRSACHGPAHPIVVLLSGAVAWCALNQQQEIRNKQALALTRFVAFLALTVSWFVFIKMIGYSYHSSAWYMIPLGKLPSYSYPLVAVYPYCLALYWLSSQSTYGSKLMRNFSLFVAWIVALEQASGSVSIMNTALAILIAWCLIGDGISKSAWWNVIAGVVLLFIAISTHLALAMTILSFSPWLSLAILGVGIILVSSFFEKRRRS